MKLILATVLLLYIVPAFVKSDDVAEATGLDSDLGLKEARLTDLNDRLLKSVNFQKIISSDVRAQIDVILKLPEVVKLFDTLRGMDIDVDNFIAFVYALFGWE